MGYEKQHSNPKSKDNRKSLRKNMTPTEAFLWKQLSGKKLDGRKFRRQHGIGKFIADFYCADENLVIELDGQVHMNPKAAKYDAKRTKYLESLGLTVIRFENKMVFENLPSVLIEIRESFNQ